MNELKKGRFCKKQSRELGFAANIRRICALEDESQLALISKVAPRMLIGSMRGGE